MKAIVSAIFGFALIINAALFVPQAWHLWKAKRADGISIPSFLGFCSIQFVGALDGHYQHDDSLLVGMAMSLLTCGTATGLAIFYWVLNRALQSHHAGARAPNDSGSPEPSAQRRCPT